jgi:glucose-6-phosphate isomerase
MAAMKLDLSASFITSHELKVLGKSLYAPKERLLSALHDNSYQSDEAFMHTPFDSHMRQRVHELVQDKKSLDPSAVVLIGIGGSNLGCVAVHQALYGLLYNEQKQIPAFYCADTIDDAQLKDLLGILEKILFDGKKILVIMVSKSGTTLETLVNAAFFINLIKKYQPLDYHRYLVCITDKDSLLWTDSMQHSIDCLPIPKKVGGRYSVFSAAGLFPLAMLGVDIDTLCAGAQEIIVDEKSAYAVTDDAALSACVLYHHWQHGKIVHDLFLFSPRLSLLGAWYRQLMGESIGKRNDLKGNLVEIGIIPTVSIGTTDLHSGAQLALGGPRVTITTFVISKVNPHSLHVPVCDDIPSVAGTHEKSVDSIKQAIIQGVQTAYHADKRPFMTVELDHITPASIGAFLYYKMIEMVYLGFLLKINPFDQPQVELYKKEARQILERKQSH